MNADPLTIRLSTPYDEYALRRLAELDSARPLTGRVLIAERDRRLVAAVALDGGRSIADPFFLSAAPLRSLRLRRYQIMRQGHDMDPAHTVLRRLVPKVTR
jgi:hypothetical protein